MSTSKVFYPNIYGGEIMENRGMAYQSLEYIGHEKSIDLPNIYIVGEAGSGKDYITDIIKELYPGYQSVVIAHPLYEMVEYLRSNDKHRFILLLEGLGLDYGQAVLAWNRVPIDLRKEIQSPLNEKPRNALQVLGDILRSFNEYLLICRAIGKTINGPTIISDVRLSFEAETLKKVGFIGVRVFAEDGVRIRRLKDRDRVVDFSKLKHKTETEVSKIHCDYLIDNTIGIKTELIYKIKDIIKGAI